MCKLGTINMVSKSNVSRFNRSIGKECLFFQLSTYSLFAKQLIVTVTGRSSIKYGSKCWRLGSSSSCRGRPSKPTVCGHSDIQKVLQHFEESCRNTRRPGGGRKGTTTSLDDRFIVINYLRERHLTSVQTKISILRSSLYKCNNVVACRPATGPKLHPWHGVGRLQFAREHMNWSLGQWSNVRVLFTDESRFYLYSPNGRKRVWRRMAERYAECAFSFRLSHNGGSAMVLIGIEMEASAELDLEYNFFSIPSYMILSYHITWFHSLHLLVLIFSWCRILPDYRLAKIGIRKFNWPACSLDVNHIVRQTPTINDLRVALQEKWENIPYN